MTLEIGHFNADNVLPSDFRAASTFLEIGVGKYGATTFGPVCLPELYVVSDLPPSLSRNGADLQKYKCFHWREESDYAKITHAYLDGTKLPFKDETFDAIGVSNIMGDPGISWDVKEKILSEAFRVLKVNRGCAGSALWLAEWVTPEYSKESIQAWLDNGNTKADIVAEYGISTEAITATRPSKRPLVVSPETELHRIFKKH